jgi:hypothetical protein
MSQLYIRPFMVKGNTVNLTVGTSSARVAATGSGQGIQSIRLTNTGSNTVFIKIGNSTVSATVAAGFPMLPNTVETFMLGKDDTHIAAIAASTGNTLYVTTGESA